MLFTVLEEEVYADIVASHLCFLFTAWDVKALHSVGRRSACWQPDMSVAVLEEEGCVWQLSESDNVSLVFVHSWRCLCCTQCWKRCTLLQCWKKRSRLTTWQWVCVFCPQWVYVFCPQLGLCFLSTAGDVCVVHSVRRRSACWHPGITSVNVLEEEV